VAYVAAGSFEHISRVVRVAPGRCEQLSRVGRVAPGKYEANIQDRGKVSPVGKLYKEGRRKEL
jgi:hypothetical protein